MSKQAISIRIRRGGRAEFIYADAGAKLLARPGVATVTRASNVEPCEPSGDGVWWTADMRPSDGPVLGPFPTRQLALDAEVAWLKSHRNL